jgi:hypothetical protein
MDRVARHFYRAGFSASNGKPDARLDLRELASLTVLTSEGNRYLLWYVNKSSETKGDSTRTILEEGRKD